MHWTWHDICAKKEPYFSYEKPRFRYEKIYFLWFNKYTKHSLPFLLIHTKALYWLRFLDYQEKNLETMSKCHQPLTAQTATTATFQTYHSTFSFNFFRRFKISRNSITSPILCQEETFYILKPMLLYYTLCNIILFMDEMNWNDGWVNTMKYVY